MLLADFPVSGLPPDVLGPMPNFSESESGSGASLGPAAHFFESGVPLADFPCPVFHMVPWILWPTSPSPVFHWVLPPTFFESGVPLADFPVSGIPHDALGPMANFSESGASLGPAAHFFESGVPLDALGPLADFPVSDFLPTALGPLIPETTRCEHSAK
jgi:hypothetical protein